MISSKPALLLATLACLSAPAHDAAAETFAVVAGADAYQHVARLSGAIADAEDLARSLEAGGARTRVLLDDGLTGASLSAALDEAIRRTRPDDVIVFSFAGHGIQIPDQDGDEADGLDEAFVLPAFRPGIGDQANLIVDDVIDDLVRRAAPRTVVFVADSCHSGTMLRAIDGRANFRNVRFLPRSSFAATSRGAVNGAPAAPTRAPESTPPNLVFLGAVPEQLVVQEVLIEGRPRGALSYAVARGLSGLADRNGDRVVSAAELMTQVPESVRVLSQNRQTPEAVAGPSAAARLFQVPAAPVAPAAAPAPAASSVWPERTPLRIATAGAGRSGGTPLDRLRGVQVVAAAEDADLILHEPSGDLLTQHGDAAARLGPARGLPLLQGIVDKWRLLRRIDEVDGTLQARVLPDDRTFHSGEAFELEITSRTAGELILFDLASDGSVIGLLPGPAGAASPIARGETQRIALQAGPPFGADHLVAVVVGSGEGGTITDLVRHAHGRPLTPDQADRLGNALAAFEPVPVAVYTAP